MDELIKDIITIVADYRNEKYSRYKIDADRVQKWVKQFDKDDQVFILTELKQILTARYISKEKAKSFLKESLEFMQIDLQYATIDNFLNDCYFLAILGNTKSQHQLIVLLQSVIKQEYNLEFENKYTNQKNIIYLDDILHTGNQVKQAIKIEFEKEDSIIKQDKNLMLLYYFIHQKQWEKVANSFNFLKINAICRRYEDISNLKPLNESTPKNVLYLQSKIEKEANNDYPPDFYRNHNEIYSVFTSEQSQKRFVDIFLQKGIEIITNTKMEKPKPNIRPLGFSLPSYKDFGFGSLCLTWLNIPNNAPLALWGTGGGFHPLFAKK